MLVFHPGPVTRSIDVSICCTLPVIWFQLLGEPTSIVEAPRRTTLLLPESQIAVPSTGSAGKLLEVSSADASISPPFTSPVQPFVAVPLVAGGAPPFVLVPV